MSPNFKQWFDGSKVVDANGQPLVVYHGTSASAPIGKFNGLESVGWFAEKAKLANRYAMDDTEYYGDDAAVYPVYLSIKNPLVLDFDMNDTADSALPVATRLGVNLSGGYEAQEVINDSRLMTAARKAGYDGFRVKEDGVWTWAPLAPEQIKSAIGNNGDFDSSNPDIRFSVPESTELPTPEFMKWFGNSKVIDPNGTPLVVYHGTAADFNSFDNAKTGANDRGLWGKGHYFSALTDGPNSYALRQGDGAQVIPVYVSIKNPLVLKTGSDLVTRLPDGTDSRKLVGPNLDGAKIKEIALSGGHDGVIQIRPNGLIGDLVAFSPEQIKSAIGNTGDFDGSNPDIRFSMPDAALLPTSALEEWFGHSKVVDANGSPLVVYHGTEADFTAFKPSDSGQYGPGIYFSSSERAAIAWSFRGRPEMARAIPVYLSLQSPYILNAGHAAPPQEVLIAQGHDGIIIQSWNGYKEYVAFRPEQVKSATDNNGDFDSSNPDIRFSVAPRISQDEASKFEHWFGDSKVVGSNGTPRVVYHGTADDFSVFDATRVGARHVDVEAGAAFFFTDDHLTANWYAKDSGKQARGGANVMPVFLSLQNPLDVDFQGEGLEYLQEEIERAKANGHDGLIARNYGDGSVSTHYVAFKPEQVKSAIGNSGQFDGTNPDIRFSIATPPFERAELGYQGGIPRRSEGEGGYGIYAYPSKYRQMRRYYTTNAEKIVSITPRAGAKIADLTTLEARRALLEIARGLAPEGRTSATLKTVHRHTWAVRTYVHAQSADAYLLEHMGVGIPTGKQLVILNEDAFDFAPSGGDEMNSITKEFKRTITEPNGKNPNGGFGTVSVYHGTTEEFQHFDINQTTRNSDLGRGFYFTDSAVEAQEHYASGKEGAARRPRTGPGRVLQAQLALRNPVVLGGKKSLQTKFLTADGSLQQAIDTFAAVVRERTSDRGVLGGLQYMLEKGFAREVNRSSIKGKGLTAHDFAEAIRYQISLDTSFAVAPNDDPVNQNAGLVNSNGGSVNEKMDFVRETFERLGFDGVIDRTKRFGSATHYIAFHAEQIQIVASAPSANPRGTEAALQAWAADTKVRDEAGELQVVYHGTTRDFTKFSEKLLGKKTGALDAKTGFFFAENPKAADMFTWEAGEPYGGNIMPVYLSITNPFVVKDLVLDGASGTRVGRIMQIAKAAGHDGVIFEKSDMLGHLGKSYAVFRPEQIKSAIGNKGTYKPETADIRFSEVEAPVRHTLRGVDSVNGTVDLPGHITADLVAERAGVASIYSWSRQPGVEADSRKALRELKAFASQVVVHDPGAPGARSYRFWSEMVSEGLVDRVLDELDQDITSGMRSMPLAPAASPEFTRWFKSSAVVDSAGLPMPVYHGTGADTGEAFRPGTFFTAKPYVAQIYATAPTRQTEEAGPNLTPVFLSIQNPFIFDAEAVGDNLSHHVLGRRGKMTEVIETLKTAGHDGLVLKNYPDLGGVQDQFVIFEPSQAKSAIGNTGAYSAAREEIRLSVAEADVEDAAEAQAVLGRPFNPPANSARALGHLNRLMARAGWEIEYIDMDLTADRPKLAVRVNREDGRFIIAKVDSVGRASFETFQRERRLAMDSSTKGRRPLSPLVDDTFLGRQRFEGARSMLRGMVGYLSDNALRPTLTSDMRSAWAGIMGSPVSQDARQLQPPKPIEHPTETAAFSRWFGSSQITSNGKPMDQGGKPLVLYHGTTADFTVFDPSRANPEGSIGAGLYFSNEPQDVDHNYAGEGADLTAKIHHQAELLVSAAEVGEEDLEIEQAIEIKRKEFIAHGGMSMPVYLKMENPLRIGGPNETFLDYEEEQDEDGEFTGRTTGLLARFIEALRWVAIDFYEVDAGKLVNDLHDAGMDDGMRASKLWRIACESEGLMYARDNNENAASGEVLRRVFADIGFDGVIDSTVKKTFGMPGMTDKTAHYIVFEPNQVKSAIGNNGEFDPENEDIRFSIAEGQPVASESPMTSLAFRRWFNGSQATDALGKPLRVYHGTNQDIASFDPSRLGQNTRAASSTAFFFSESPVEAAEYAELAGRTQIIDAVSVEARVEQLRIATAQAEARRDWDRAEQLYMEMEALELGAINADPSGQNILAVYLSVRNPKVLDMEGAFDGHVVAKAIAEAKAEGHDGLKLLNAYDPVSMRKEAFTTTQWVVFSPEQIKSSIGNRGRYDPRSADLRFSVARHAGAPAFDRWFNGSVVTEDEKPGGEPLVVYHGTTGDFDAFNLDYSGADGVAYSAPAIFATSDQKLASAYGTNKLDRVIADAYRTLQHFKNKNPGVYDAEFDKAYQGVQQAFTQVKASGRGTEGGGANVMPLYMALKNPLVVDAGGERFMAVMPERIAQAVADGNDGLIVRNVIDNASPDTNYPATVYIAFSEKQVKSALGNSGAFSPETADIRFSSASESKSPRWWRSTLRDAVEGVDIASAPARGWHDALTGLVNKGRVKPAEIEWSGITDWLEMQSAAGRGRLTKAEVLNALDMHSIQVQEFISGKDSFKAKYEDYGGRRLQLPNAQGYRELLLTLPVKPSWDVKLAEGRFRIWNADTGDFARNPDGTLLMGHETLEAAQAEARKLGGPLFENFHSIHWTEHPNVLAHIRFNERVDAEGARTLFVEEIQSDWAQAGRRQGLRRTPAAIKALVPGSLDALMAIADGDLGPMRREVAIGDGMGTMVQTLQPATKSEKLPAAPFIGSTDAWVGLCIKRIISYAATEGFDKVAFITGQQSVERYRLDKKLARVSAMKMGERFQIFGTDLDGNTLNYGVLTLVEIESLLGKALAEKIAAQPTPNDVYSGKDLVVGGKGMRDFYDRIVPQVAKELLRKLGSGQMGVVEVDTGEAGDSQWIAFSHDVKGSKQYFETEALALAYAREQGWPAESIDIAPVGKSRQPGFSITSALREMALRGLPLFSFAGERATTANTGRRLVAKERIAHGESPESARQATGWHQGADKKWRFEISDEKAKLLPSLKSLRGGGHEAREIAHVTYRFNADDGTYDLTLAPPSPQTTSDFVCLFRAQPEVLDAILPEAVYAQILTGAGEEDYINNFQDALRLPAKFMFEGMNALPLDQVLEHPELFKAYPALQGVMVMVDPKLGTDGNCGLLADGTRVIGLGVGLQLDALLHEVQHIIQDIEEFATGTMPSAVGMEAYRLAAGEVEARNTTARRRMTAQERMEVSPETTQDVETDFIQVSAKPDAGSADVGRVRQAIAELLRVPGPELPTGRGKIVVVDSSFLPSSWMPLSSSLNRIGDAIGQPDPQVEVAIAKSLRRYAQAFYDPVTHTTGLVADRIAPGTEVGVFLHEMTHKYGRQALAPGAWERLITTLKGWEDKPASTIEAKVYYAALARATKSNPQASQDILDEELFAYAVEECYKRGVRPTAAAADTSAEKWLDTVVTSLYQMTLRLIGAPAPAMTAQDIVDLAYALAQLETPAHAERINEALRILNAIDVEATDEAERDDQGGGFDTAIGLAPSSSGQ